MLREHQAVWRTIFIAMDLTVSVSAFIAAYWIRFDWGVLPVATEVPRLSAYLQVTPVLVLILWITNSHFRLYLPRRTGSFVDEMADVVKSNFIAALLLMTFFFMNRSFSYSRATVAIFALLNPVAGIIFRFVIRLALRSLRARGYNLRAVLIVGTGRTAQELLHRLRKNPWTGIRLAGLVSRQPEEEGRRIHDVPVIGATDDLDTILDRHEIDQVYIALPGSQKVLVEDLARRLSQKFVAVRIVPDISYYVTSDQLTNFDGLPVLHLWENRLTGWNVIAKRLMDIVVASVCLIACLVPLVVIAVLVKLTSKGPILYRQQRMGLDGRIFYILKFRTMKADAPAPPAWTERDDARCTPFGKRLRRTSLDELPQLFNVLFGQMSMVGPRPERPALIEKFRRKFPRYMLRHQVKAGITGWAQVNGWRGNTSLRKRLQYDLYYMTHWSIWFDLKILALTALRGLLHRNAY